jgi:hypothetical protein
MQKIIFYFLVMIPFVLQCCKNNQKKITENTVHSSEVKKVERNNILIHDSLIKYQGSWFWKSKDSSGTFKLVLVLKTDSLYGKYCAAYNFGNRMDCDFDTSTLNIRGFLHQDSLLINFNSFYGAENGVAFIEIKGDSLLWRILKYPQGGDCFAPPYAVMSKKIKNW